MEKISYLNTIYGDETAERIRQNMEKMMSLYSHTLLSMEFEEEVLCIRSEKEYEKIINVACTRNATEQFVLDYEEYKRERTRQHRAERARQHRLEEREKRLERRG